MSKSVSFESYLSQQGVSRRSFLKYCAAMASLLALPASAIPALSEKLRHAVRPSVIWLSFQECTGCTESLTRSHAPTIEELMFDYISLDYHHTLQAASGEAAEQARIDTMNHSYGKYLLIVDGSIPIANGGVYSTIAGRTNLDILKECSAGAAAVIAVGSCAAFGGLPAAEPNPTGATSVASLMDMKLIAEKYLVNIPGCPPLPVAISGVLAHYLAFDKFPALDELKRPVNFYGNTVHERCSRYHFYKEEKFAESFDDEGARKGWCLYKLGCKGPVTHNACAVHKWNKGTSFPVESGHPCIGCSEPDFWDRGGLYQSMDDIAFAFKPVNETTDSAVEEGRNLYQDNCVYCHSTNASEFEVDAENISKLLRDNSIRAHRRLEFSNDQIKILEAYLKSTK
ncbi:MAG: Ni/Fe hydrogenase [endosymbiont of Galathealinum brachiosum]|uniref:hydrogenase (acceptor) n=1 Tax=endosymbiont of Galathealinum brachiosum TaxID=2200906 RepID=A0A370D9W4_9GAMM|nr:MAG: Ni/Fe hydrogenase [endosymbiont of Galathealinum brachiosum]